MRAPLGEITGKRNHQYPFDEKRDLPSANQLSGRRGKHVLAFPTLLNRRFRRRLAIRALLAAPPEPQRAGPRPSPGGRSGIAGGGVNRSSNHRVLTSTACHFSNYRVTALPMVRARRHLESVHRTLLLLRLLLVV